MIEIRHRLTSIESANTVFTKNFPKNLVAKVYKVPFDEMNDFQRYGILTRILSENNYIKVKEDYNEKLYLTIEYWELSL